MEKVRFWMVNPLFKIGKIKDTNLEFVIIYSERDKVYRRYIIRQKEE